MHDVIPHWLDNAPFSGSSTRAGEVTNPATGEVSRHVAFASRDDADREKLMKTVFKGSGKVEIGRFKGLGEMLPAQLKETTMDPKKRLLLKVVVEADDKPEASDAVERLMGNKPEARFAFIQERAAFADEADLDI